jgi:hypothetical protein
MRNALARRLPTLIAALRRWFSYRPERNYMRGR